MAQVHFGQQPQHEAKLLFHVLAMAPPMFARPNRQRSDMAKLKAMEPRHDGNVQREHHAHATLAHVLLEVILHVRQVRPRL
jgi:hypothetical protein